VRANPPSLALGIRKGVPWKEASIGFWLGLFFSLSLFLLVSVLLIDNRVPGIERKKGDDGSKSNNFSLARCFEKKTSFHVALEPKEPKVDTMVRVVGNFRKTIVVVSFFVYLTMPNRQLGYVGRRA
jgi:hypothetical protein